MKSPTYRPEIDGIRALAVMSVIFFHADFSWIEGGYLGVDVFFVISGYLISKIILADIERGRFSFRDFYARRIRRIIPALFLMMTVTIPLGFLLLSPGDHEEYSNSIVATIFHVSNFFFMRRTGYFSDPTEEMPLIHTWSLSVEEQFYLLFPLFFLWVMTRQRNKALAWVLLALGVSFLMAKGFGLISASKNFYMTTGRIWELLAGVVCMLLERQYKPAGNQLLSMLGLGLVATAFLLFTRTTPTPSEMTLIPVLGTCLLVLFAQKGTLTYRLLVLKPVVWIGLISYSAYLWHQPIFAFTRHLLIFKPDQSIAVALIVGTLLLSYLSWRFVEQPFRKSSVSVDHNKYQVWKWYGLGVLVFTLVGSAGSFTDGRKALWQAMATEQEGHVYNLFQTATDQSVSAAYADSDTCIWQSTKLTASVIEKMQRCRAQHGPGIALIGDSHAQNSFTVLSSAPNGNQFIVSLGSPGCHPYDRNKDCLYEDFRSLVNGHSDLFKYVIYEQAAYFLFELYDGFSKRRNMFSKVKYDGLIPEDYQFDEQRIRAVSDYLSELGSKLPVYWLGPRPEPHIPLDFAMKVGCEFPFQFRRGYLPTIGRLNESIIRSLSQTAVRFIPQSELSQFDLSVDYMTCQETFWIDSDHLSIFGGKRFGERMQLLRKIENGQLGSQ